MQRDDRPTHRMHIAVFFGKQIASKRSNQTNVHCDDGGYDPQQCRQNIKHALLPCGLYRSNVPG